MPEPTAHEGHRSRLRRRFLEEGLDSFQPHEIIELLLFFAIPYRDTNELAHRLIGRFGGLVGLLNAPYSELIRENGVGEAAATLLKLIPAIGRRYAVEHAAMEDIILGPEDAGRYLMPRFHGFVKETAMLLCLDGKGKALGVAQLSLGDVSSTQISSRNIVAEALRFNAVSVVLAHNHTSGIAFPSKEDVQATMRLREALMTVDVMLLDHIIVSDNDFVSLLLSNMIPGIDPSLSCWR